MAIRRPGLFPACPERVAAHSAAQLGPPVPRLSRPTSPNAATECLLVESRPSVSPRPVKRAMFVSDLPMSAAADGNGVLTTLRFTTSHPRAVQLQARRILIVSKSPPAA